MDLRQGSTLLLAVIVVGGVLMPLLAGGVVSAQDTEPNDSFETAVNVSEGTFTGEITSGESDFFKLDANSTDALKVDITNADNLNDLAIRIYDADREQLIADGNDFDGIDATIKLPDDGTYYIEVAGQDSDITSSYTLNIDVITPAENDQFAPNDGFESAASLSEGPSNARIVGGESDYYQIDANTTDAIKTDITNADNLNDIRLTLYGPDRQEIVTDNNDFDGINFNVKAPETGTYYIEVAGEDQETTSDYTLNTDIVTPAENDQFAPNDGFESAASLSEGLNDARIVGGESDYYQFEANTTDAISVDIINADDLNDIRLTLYGPDRQEIVTDNNDFDGINFNVKAPETDTYYIEVAGEDQETSSDYTLDTDIITPAENDQFAPNDGFDSAADLPEGFSDARIVGGESDFYQLEANATDAISVDITNADDLNDLRLTLYGPDRQEIVTDNNDFDGINFNIKAPETGTYYVEVAGEDQQTTSGYTLGTDVIIPTENDQFAPNDDFESAVQIRDEFTDARIVGGEADYFKITLNESESVEAELTSADSLNDLELRLYSTNRTEVAADDNDFDGISVSHQASTGGTYYLMVAGLSQQTTSAYTLRSTQTFTAASPVQIEDLALTPNTVESDTTNTHSLTFSVTNVSADGTADELSVTLPESVSLVETNAGRVVDQRANALASITDGSLTNGTSTITVNPQASSGPPTRTLDAEFNVTVAAPNVSATTTDDISVAFGDSANGDDNAAASLTVEGPGPGDVTGNGVAAQDVDGDGQFEDIDGNGELNIFDVQALFDNRASAAVQNNAAAFDFDNDGSTEISVFDVQALFTEQQAA